MNPGLLYLLRKRPLGWLRSLRRRVRGGRGVAALLGALALAGLLVASQWLVPRQEADEALLASMRLWAPLGLSALALFSALSGPGLAFRASEVDFLFPAPIRRSELLLYYAIGNLLTALLSALWIAIFLLRWSSLWYAGFAALFLGVAFVWLSSVLVALALSVLWTRLAKAVRRTLGLGLLAAAGLLAGSAGGLAPGAQELATRAHELAASTPVRVVAAPAGLVVDLFLAASPGEAALRLAGVVALLAALFGGIVALDRAHDEAALRASALARERMRRLRSGGAASALGAGSAHFSLPAPPRLGGVGPIAWREALETLRTGMRGVLVLSLLALAPILTIVGLGTGDGRPDRDAAVAAGLIVAFPSLAGDVLTQGFRRDLLRIAYLKSLPLPPEAVALGQLLPGIAVLSALQAAGIAIVLVSLDTALPFPLAALLLLLPWNWLVLALDNLLFLRFPYRQDAGLTTMGRSMLVIYAKLLGAGSAAGVAGLAGWVLGSLSGGSIALGALAAAAVLAGVAAGLTAALGRAFARFDVTADVPA